ncbi:MAG: LamG domain-containing protein [Lewinellaceae bacterium]|nr:LamG domain-containing protein [Lewinellaceae bacterium]
MTLYTTNPITERSVSFWFLAGAAAQMPLFQGGNASGATGSGYFIGTYQPGGLPGVSWDTTYGLVVDFINHGVYIPFPEMVNGWHHIAVSWDGASSSIKVSIDGQFPQGYLYNSGTGGFAALPGGQPFSLGVVPNPAGSVKTRFGVNFGTKLWNTGLDKMNGALDEVRIYSRALTDGEMRLLADTYATATPPALCAGQTTATLSCLVPGANSYQWRNLTTGATIGTSASVSPAITTTTSFEISAVAGACMYKDTLEVLVLTQLQIGNITTTDLSGSFTVSGGLPQVDGSNYSSVTMTLQGNPGVSATLSTAPFGHGETVSFLAPEAGVYMVGVSDAAGCSGTSTITIISTGNSGQDTLPPCIEWQVCLGGTGIDWNDDVIPTSDNGFWCNWGPKFFWWRHPWIPRWILRFLAGKT